MAICVFFNCLAHPEYEETRGLPSKATPGGTVNTITFIFLSDCTGIKGYEKAHSLATKDTAIDGRTIEPFVTNANRDNTWTQLSEALIEIIYGPSLQTASKIQHLWSDY